jgi:hypothetical protein
MNKSEIEKKIAVLKLAQAHQIEMLNMGVISNLEHFVHDDEDGNEDWEYHVSYLDVVGNGDTGCSFTGCSFDKESI